MKQKSKNKHEFALHYDLTGLQKSRAQTSLVITDQDIIHRITRVLRLQQGEQLVLFDQHQHALIELGASNKKELNAELLDFSTNTTLTPEITFFLPLLKRDDFESALYALTEVGINAIQLVITEKTQRSLTPKEVERAERTIIAAAEQSKNFNFPQLRAPISFAECVILLQKKSGLKLFFDPEGTPLFDQIIVAREQKTNKLSLMIGPEADLTSDEKTQLRAINVTFCALTPTILRACQAAAVTGAIFRSVL